MEQTNPLPNPPMPPEMPTNPPVNSSSPNKTVLIILSVLFLVILSSSVTYLLVKSPTPPQAPAISPAPIVQPSTAIPSPISPTPTPDLTANWKTYKDEVLGFEFKYPPDPNWKIKSGALYNYDIDKAPGRDYIPSIDGNLFKIEFSLDKNFSDVNKWFEEEKRRKDPINDQPYEFSNIKSIIVDSQKGIYFEVKERFIETWVGSAIFESPKGGLINFRGGLNFQANKDLFTQILSTIRFLE